MSDEKEVRDWTIMIYLAGDNNLSDEMIWALKEMYRVGIDCNCHVAAQFDPSAINFSPRRYYLDKLAHDLDSTSCDVDGILELDALRKTLASDGSEPDLNQENSANPLVLSGFLDQVLRDMKAEHHMLILSGHGSGAMGGLLEDHNPYGRLTLPSLGRALSVVHGSLHGKKIDILGLDSCTMGMVEVAHEVRDNVEYLVGAEGFVRNTGWPYHRLLESLRRRLQPPQLAEEIVNNYFHYYSDFLAADVSTDQSVVHIGAESWDDCLIHEMSGLSQSLCSELGKAKNDTVRNALVLAHWEAQSFNNEQHVDLYDFCERLTHYLPESAYGRIRNHCGAIRTNWQRIVPLSTHSGPLYQYAHGLSIYFPWSEVPLQYKNLAFARETGWDRFLQLYVDKTCREPRDDERHRLRKEKPQSIQRTCDGGFVGIGGFAVHRAGGLDGVKGGGRDSAKGGGRDSAKYGSLSAEELVRLSCMKNFPVGFYQPKLPSEGKAKQIIARRNKEILRQGICDSSDAILQSVVSRLPKAKKECIAGALKNGK